MARDALTKGEMGAGAAGEPDEQFWDEFVDVSYVRVPSAASAMTEVT